MVNETPSRGDPKEVEGCIVEQEKFISSKKNVGENLNLNGLQQLDEDLNGPHFANKNVYNKNSVANN